MADFGTRSRSRKSNDSEAAHEHRLNCDGEFIEGFALRVEAIASIARVATAGFPEGSTMMAFRGPAIHCGAAIVVLHQSLVLHDLCAMKDDADSHWQPYRGRMHNVARKDARRLQ
jgi:hypothetical protein